MNNTVAQIFPSQKGNSKISVNGYIMVKDKNRRDIYYWCCERRKSLACNGELKTILLKVIKNMLINIIIIGTSNTLFNNRLRTSK